MMTFLIRCFLNRERAVVGGLSGMYVSLLLPAQYIPLCIAILNSVQTYEAAPHGR
jgi:hypothetical protein